MKKLLVLMLTFTMAISLTACGAKKEDANATAASETEDLLEDDDTEDEKLLDEDEEEPAEEIAKEEPVEEEVFEEKVAEEEPEFPDLEALYSIEENHEAAQKEIDEVFQSYTDYYSDISFDVKGNNFIYKYTFIEEMDPETSGQEIVANLEATSDEDKQSIRNELVGASGITAPITVTFSYYQPDGETLLCEYDMEIE